MTVQIRRAVAAIFRAFFNICLLKSKPQDLPLSYDLLGLCLILYTIINIILVSTSSPVANAVISGLLETALITVITLTILKLNQHTERWVKTLTALAGTGSIISLLALPLFIGGILINSDGLLQVLLVILYLSLIIWNVVIMGHILRYAMDTSMGAGIVFACIYIVISSILIRVLVPEMEAGA